MFSQILTTFSFGPRQFGEINRFFLKVKEAYDQDPAAKIGFERVNCTTAEQFCKSQNITELLEIKYFAKNDDNNQEMLKFIKERVDESLLRHAAEEDAKAKLKDGNSFVKFHSPNCTACQGMAHDWTELEKAYANSQNVKILSIDCKIARMTCKKFKIAHFPTMIFFENGKADEAYSGEWTVKAFISTIEKRLETCQKVVETKNHVLYLTPETFNKSVSTGTVFVKFNLLGCTHCVVSLFQRKKLKSSLSKTQNSTNVFHLSGA